MIPNSYSDDYTTDWHQEMRTGIFRTLTFYRRRLSDGVALSDDERKGLIEFLTLAGEIIAAIQPIVSG